MNIKNLFFIFILLFFHATAWAADPIPAHVGLPDLENSTGGKILSEVLNATGLAQNIVSNSQGATQGIYIPKYTGGTKVNVSNAQLTQLALGLDDFLRQHKNFSKLLTATKTVSRLGGFLAAAGATTNIYNDIQKGGLARGIVGAIKEAFAFGVNTFFAAKGATIGATFGTALGPLGTLAGGVLGGVSAGYVSGKVIDYFFEDKVNIFWTDHKGLDIEGKLAGVLNNYMSGKKTPIKNNDALTNQAANDILVSLIAERFTVGVSTNQDPFVFSIPNSTGGFIDVSVPANTNFTFRLSDFAVEDGDRVHVTVESVAGKLFDTNVSLTNAGRIFSSAITSGPVELRLEALNEGRLSPNTGAVNITSPVKSGPTNQQFNLNTGDVGILRVLAE